MIEKMTLNDINFELRHKVMNLDPAFSKCFQCGTCVSSCIATRCIGGEKYNPRQTVTKALYGSKSSYDNPSMWSCAMCHRCEERCPEGAKPTELFAMLKNMAYAEGLAPEHVNARVKMIIETGGGFPLTPVTNSVRKRLGLDDFVLPDTRDLRVIAEKTGLKLHEPKGGGL